MKYHQQSARLAACVYQPDEGVIRNALHGLGFCASVAEIISGSAPLNERAMIVPTGEVVFLVFCGTRNFAQWISNVVGMRKVNFYPNLSNERCHKGFLDGYTSIQGQVNAQLEMWRRRKLVIVGHSRGAATALLAAKMLRTDGFAVAEIHIFGCPRVFDPAGAAFTDACFKSICWRWIANNDTVCRIPLRWQGFRHVGQEMYFDSSDRLHRSPSLLTKLIGQIRGRKKNGWFDGISDHNAAKEYQRLIANLELSDG